MKKKKKEMIYNYKIIFYEQDKELVEKLLSYAEESGMSLRAIFIKAVKLYLEGVKN